MNATRSSAFFVLSCLIATVTLAAPKPKAPTGFKWRVYKEAFCELQVPAGWFEDKRSAGKTNAILLSPVKIEAGKGIDTGFTMNAVQCASQEEWRQAMELAGKMMSDARKATEHPVDSRVEDTGDMLFMVVEGERLIPDSPHPDKKYHVRAIVRAFPKYATIYMYSFGAPVEDWDAAWKTGSVIFSPVWFTLPR